MPLPTELEQARRQFAAGLNNLTAALAKIAAAGITVEVATGIAAAIQSADAAVREADRVGLLLDRHALYAGGD